MASNKTQASQLLIGTDMAYKTQMNGMGLYEIKPDGKGSVHKDLRGWYTSPTEANKAILNFQTKQKVGKDGADSTNG